jgi:hypothetical protein
VQSSIFSQSQFFFELATSLLYIGKKEKKKENWINRNIKKKKSEL